MRVNYNEIKWLLYRGLTKITTINKLTIYKMVIKYRNSKTPLVELYMKIETCDLHISKKVAAVVNEVSLQTDTDLLPIIFTRNSDARKEEFRLKSN